MKRKNTRAKVALLMLIALLTASACAPAQQPPRPTVPYVPSAGTVSFMTGRNPTSDWPGGFKQWFTAAVAAGEGVVRIHLDHGITEIGVPPGTVNEFWLDRWEQVFDEAEAQGLQVIPAFAIWANWNDGRDGSPIYNWDSNSYNVFNRGPCPKPEHLLRAGACQDAWVNWVSQVVSSLKHHKNIYAWELFSEVDLISGFTQEEGLRFVERVAEVVRAADGPTPRPTTVSMLAGVTDTWPEVWQSDAVDIQHIHPYHTDLFQTIRDEVSWHLNLVRKPVIIGESGMTGYLPYDASPDRRPRVAVGYRQAQWAALMSGSSTGGMFWWYSGYSGLGGIYDMDGKYPDINRPINDFVKDLDFTGAYTVSVSGPPALSGLALRTKNALVGYARDNACVFPDWPATEVTGQTIEVEAAEQRNATVEFVRPVDLSVIGTRTVAPRDGMLSLALPPFEEDIAFRITFK